ncbi:MAG: ABC transporter substrate-binding protein, partial [Vulcanimicrobiaceae bacterium]
MKQPRKPTITRRGAIAAGAAAVATFGSVSIVRAQAKLRKLQVVLGTTPQFSNVIIGLSKGFYEKEGLPVEITYFTSGSAATQAFRTGNGDIAVSGDLPSLKLWTNGDGVGLCPQAHYDLS